MLFVLLRVSHVAVTMRVLSAGGAEGGTRGASIVARAFCVLVVAVVVALVLLLLLLLACLGQKCVAFAGNGKEGAHGTDKMDDALCKQ